MGCNMRIRWRITRREGLLGCIRNLLALLLHVSLLRPFIRTTRWLAVAGRNFPGFNDALDSVKFSFYLLVRLLTEKFRERHTHRTRRRIVLQRYANPGPAAGSSVFEPDRTRIADRRAGKRP